MRKEISDKVYTIIIMILVFSIVYQTGFLIVNAKDSLPEVLATANQAKDEKQEDVTLSTNETNLVFGVSDENTNNKEKDKTIKESNNVKESKNANLFLYLLKQGIPYDDNSSEYDLNSVIKYLTKLDISDPKTLISSQLPIMDNYEDDNLEITTEEQQEIYSITTSKPLNDDKIEVNQTSDKPLVLLYSTHTTESYMSSKVKIDYSSYARSRNEKYNMIAVNKEIKKVLEEKYNINVILDTTVHDYPSYDSSYGNSLQTIKKNLEKNPTIKYVFDIHRDGLADNKKNKEKYATVINEVNSAKIMMVVGLNHENSAKNSEFSDKVYKTLNSMYPSFTLPTVKRSTAKYNQFVSDNALLFEVGSNLSTLEEAKASGKFLGDALGKIITENESN